MPAEAQDVPEFGVDYCWLRRAECEDKIAVLLPKDCDSKAIPSQIVESKGVQCEEVIEAALRVSASSAITGKLRSKRKVSGVEIGVKIVKGPPLITPSCVGSQSSWSTCPQSISSASTARRSTSGCLERRLGRNSSNFICSYFGLNLDCRITVSLRRPSWGQEFG